MQGGMLARTTGLNPVMKSLSAVVRANKVFIWVAAESEPNSTHVEVFQLNKYVFISNTALTWDLPVARKHNSLEGAESRLWST